MSDDHNADAGPADLAAVQQLTTDRLAAAAPTAVAALTGFADHHPARSGLLLQALIGLDHAVECYALDEQRSPGESLTLFDGIGDLIDAHPDLPLRHDEVIADAVTDWCEQVWQAAGGSCWPTPSYWMTEGDSDWLDLATGQWEPGG